jgi:exodeoxyribonuclease VIII
MTQEEYDKLNALNYTGAKLILRSPKLYKHWLDNKTENDEDTPALRMGRLIHLATLQPDLYDAKIAIAPPCDRRTKDGKEIWSNFVNTVKDGQEIVTQSESEMITSISISAKEGIDIVTKDVGSDVKRYAEKVVVAKHNGIDIKGRPDFWCGDIVIDIKSTQDAKSFSKDVVNYKYFMQAAWYLNLTKAKKFYFVAVEKTAPFDFAIYTLDDEALAEGQKLMDKACALYGECNLYKVFPGYSKDIQTLSLPKWALNNEM